jgi:hypothetical protein
MSLQFPDIGSFLIFLHCPLPKDLKGLLALIPLGIVDDRGVHRTVDATFSELHFVTSESTGLVGKDVGDLAKLLYQRRCSAEGWCVGWGIVHVEIRVDQGCLPVFDHFDRHDQSTVSARHNAHSV